LADVADINRLLQEVAEHLQNATEGDQRTAISKLERIAASASTLALTIQCRRR
jgi:hypothetical protein